MGLNIPDDVLEMMMRLKELWAHVDPALRKQKKKRNAQQNRLSIAATTGPPPTAKI